MMKKFKVRWQLVLYDVMIYSIIALLLLLFYKYSDLSVAGVGMQMGLSLVCILTARFVGKVYQQIWRYGGIQCYIRLLITDGIAFIFNVLLERILPMEHIAFAQLLAIVSMNLLCTLAIRMIYRYAYKCGDNSFRGKILNLMLKIFAGSKAKVSADEDIQKIKIAIVGAGRIGVSLAEELFANKSSAYVPRCYIDVNEEKANRSIHGVPVLLENEDLFGKLKDFEIQEIVFAVPNVSDSYKKQLYKKYLDQGYKIKVYDYPFMQTTGSKRYLREFDIEELLFRRPIAMHNEKTNSYYKDKVVMITGGGGSIGSELCRQLAKMEPKQIVVLDIYENGAYDIQQELKIRYGDTLDLRVEIASICNMRSMHRVFATYNPQIVINAAAHKHVPLMEQNCIEAIENNVFGTKVLVELCEQYSAERFMLVSTDKAVNPTNVMGATKRMCEMIVGSASTYGKVKYSSTRFGNVLGSAGSVIPLFKKQIAAGGPITLTDKRIIRYFMTIPEAAQLVLQSGAMAKNGELFVLDMGQPIKIYDLAQNMIRLSGVSGIEIREIGLRPGEKLYEELLIKAENLSRTENNLIFIEKDTPLSKNEIVDRLNILKEACLTENDEAAKKALKTVVPSYHSPQSVNSQGKAMK